jgi:hypothetical protein
MNILKLTLFGSLLILLAECDKPPSQNIPPWTVVCDKKSGKFNFVDNTRTPWTREFDTREDAVAYMAEIEQIVNEEKAANAIRSRKWEICPRR